MESNVLFSFFFIYFFVFFFFFRFLFIITTNYGFNSGPSDRTSTCFTDTLSTALPLVGKPEKSEWMNRQRTNKQRETRSQSLIRSVTSPTGCIFLPSIFLFSLLSLSLSVSLSFFFPVSFFFFFFINSSIRRHSLPVGSLSSLNVRYRFAERSSVSSKNFSIDP